MIPRATALLLCLSLPSLAAAEGAVTGLSGAIPGEPAPPLTASQWARGEPVRRFEPGRMYAIDLWATWCKPCQWSMPILRDLEAKYGDDLTIVAMNVWEVSPERVPEFLETWKDSMVQRVALDSIPPGKEANEGLTALAFTGTSVSSKLPQTFLIDADGKVAWIGSPEHLEERYLGVRNGTWDRLSFADSFKTAFAAERRYLEHLGRIEAKLESEDWDGAYDECEATVAADTAFVPTVIRQGYTNLAMRILHAEPTPQELAIAYRAMERALALSPSPGWDLLELASDVAAKGDDLAAARAHLRSAIAAAPDDEKVLLQAKLDALDADAGEP